MGRIKNLIIKEIMKVYKIQFEDIDNDCWGRTENYGWKDYDSNLYACKELAKINKKYKI